jgi:hypothetical protein
MLLRLSERWCTELSELTNIAALLIITCQFDPAQDSIVQAQWGRVERTEIRTGFLLQRRAIEEGGWAKNRVRSVELARSARAS